MTKGELHPLLQAEYQPGQATGGGERGLADPYKSTWFVIPPLPSSQRPEGINLEILGAAHRVMREIPRADSLSTLDQMILGLLVRREAVASSRIEGTWSTIDHVLTPGDAGENEKSTTASVRGYALALESAFDRVLKTGPAGLTSKLMRDLHRAIMSRDPGFTGTPGTYRHELKPSRYVTIGGFPRPENSVYNPVPPRHLAEGLHALFRWLHDEVRLTLPLRMALGHVYFEALHPFLDGNGRVGRMLMVLQMVSEGLTPLYLSGYIEMRKPEYMVGLAQAQKRLNYAPIVNLIADAIVVSWEESQRSKQILLQLPEIWKSRGRFRKHSGAERTLDILLSNPILTASHLQQLIDISAPAANNALKQLIQARILRERTGQGRNRIFAAEEVVAILGRPLTETPTEARDRGFAILAEMQ